MSRLISIQPRQQDLPAELVVGVGDVLQFAATGGHLRTGTAIELIGILNDSVVGTNGQVLSPLGAPGTVLFRAVETGRAVLDIVTGDPWQSPITLTVNVRVE
ncbi:hypothetical protein J2X01_003585 [Arthrobacter ginsengisoli]|uniref:Uncharacterized protein n=1 Tax=Arthrobacter ginsengisoli TaxID=1356565 RepID=A0ABU1UGH8_9MICC|nr:hypothetical protein [Arthrobacter ginsengisoli]MDR7084277.1 hypothetical protein [Arthrobacter ginsengisoli]